MTWGSSTAAGGNEGEVVHGVLVLLRRIGDHGGKGGLAARAGGGGDGDQVGDLAPDVQQALERCQGALGVGDAGAHCLRAVDAGAAAKGDKALAALLEVDLAGVLDVFHGRVGPGLVIDRAANALRGEKRLQGLRRAEGPQRRVGHQQRRPDAALAQQGGDLRYAVVDRRVAIGQKRKGMPGNDVKRVAIGPENEVHCRELLLNSPMAGLYMDKRHAKRRNDAPLGPAGPAILGRLFAPCQGRPEWGDAAALPKKAAGHLRAMRERPFPQQRSAP